MDLEFKLHLGVTHTHTTKNMSLNILLTVLLNREGLYMEVDQLT